MNMERLAVVSLRAENVAQTAHFYRDVLGLQLAGHHGHMPDFNLNGTYLTIVKGRAAPKSDTLDPRFPRLAFEVTDLDEAVTRLRQHAVELPWGVEQRETTRWVMFYDPAGNLIELVEFGQTASD